MNSPESSNFFSRQQHGTSAKDNPLSMKGRFSRLSYIAWYGFLQLIFICAVIAWTMTVGIFNLNTLSLDANFSILLSGLNSIGFIVIAVLYIYFNVVINVRRFHDLNRSGWWTLCLLIPMINILVVFYLLLAAGSYGRNAYGNPRQNAIWEKILAWFIIILSILSILGINSTISFLMGSGEFETPREILQNSTDYF